MFAYRDSAPPVDEQELLRIREAMRRRGPDGAGTWISADRRLGLASRRLSIIDLHDSGAQPMASPDGRLHVTFNGEIFNYRQLRRELEATGAVFRSQSDTEVLLQLYAQRGAEMVDVLRGMYAFAIWDARERTLFLARDPFGIKPLYVTDDGAALRFASQVKALLAGGRVNTAPNPAGSVGFFLWGAVPDPHTLFEGVNALPAGTHLTYRPEKPGTPCRFFSIADELMRGEDEAEGTSRDDLRARLGEALRDSVRHHLVADVPVGVFLSSGLDSTTLTALAAEEGGSGIRTLTLGFHEYRGTQEDEVPLAEEVAERYGTRHYTSWISETDFEEALPDLLEAMDQPTIDGVNTYFVSRAAAKAGMKVALSGLGSDELFGGYPSVHHVPRLARWLRIVRAFPSVGRAIRRLAESALRPWTSPKYAGLLEYGGSYPGAYLLRRSLFMPWELDRFLDSETVRAGLERLDLLPSLQRTIGDLHKPRLRVAALELEWYMRNQLLRDADWAGMAHSVEIRVPFVDVTFLRAVAPLLAHKSAPGKTDVAATPHRALPAAVLARRKTGFTTPASQWIRQPGLSPARGLRGWACVVHPPARAVRILGLMPDAYGGDGGIALYGRDLLEALCGTVVRAKVTAVPRLMPNQPEPLPSGLRYVTSGINSKGRFVVAVLRLLLERRPRYDVVICGHLNLLPVAFLAKWVAGAPVVLLIYGIEAWSPPGSLLLRCLARRADWVISISGLTLGRFTAWSGVGASRTKVLPNAVHMEWYGVGPKNPALLSRHGLSGKPVLMTLGRMVSAERYKGFDEVLEVMPRLLPAFPDLTYLIVGYGSDMERLGQKAGRLGLEGHVIFAGRIPEAEKADYYRLADAYVMPSRGEGFGFVLLEAMACGVPVVASSIDGGREATRDGLLGVLVDPSDLGDVTRGIMEALRRPREVPPGLEHFSFGAFQERVRAFVDEVLRLRMGSA